MELPDYMLFIPPMELDFANWSRKTARSYFDWFLGQISERKDELARLVSRLSPGCRLDDSPDSLRCLGEVFVSEVRTRPSTQEEIAQQGEALTPRLREVVETEVWELTDRTLSLCLDVGIYFAEVLHKEHPTLEWDLWTRKTVEYNRPVLVGFRGNVPLDAPGILVNIARRKVDGQHQVGELKRVFEHWSSMVSN